MGLRPAAVRSRDAFTLTELLVVISIIVLLSAVAAASWVGITRRAAREGAAQDLSGILRQARLAAVDSGRGAVVRIDPIERSIYGLSSQIEAAWHFEEIIPGPSNTTPGAKLMNGTVYGPVVWNQAGAVGLCLDFPSSTDHVDCGNLPVYDQADGIRIEAHVRPGSDGDVIAKHDPGGPDGYRMFLTPAAGLNFDLEATFETDAGQIALDSGPTGDGLVAANRWSHVAAEFDGFQARILINGVQVDAVAAPAPPALLERATAVPLVIGGGGFQGQVDEPRLLSVAGGSRVQLPPRVPVWTTDPAIHLDGEGYLDLAYHSAPALIALGDPYQAARLAAGIGAGAGALDVEPRNPFPAGGGWVMVGTDAAGYELMSYSSAGGPTLAGLGRGAGAVAHAAGEDVLLARVIQIGQTGLVERLD